MSTLTRTLSGVSLLDLLPPELQTCPRLWRKCLRVARETCRGLPLFTGRDIRSLARQRYEWITAGRNWDGRWSTLNGSAGLRGGKGGSREVRRRAPKRETEYKFVRRCSAKYQARVWCPLPIGSVNLGLYEEESAAWDAVRRWLRAGADPCRHLPAGILPKWVVHGHRPIPNGLANGLTSEAGAGEDGRDGVPRSKRKGRKVDECSPLGFYAVRNDVVLGPFDDAEQAFKAMEQRLRER